MKIEDKIINININDIKPYKNNVKKHPQEQIKNIIRSIKEYGFNVPIVIDSKKEIICGHGRYLAAKKIGITEIPCIKKDDLTDIQVKSLRIADNKLNETEWDLDSLKTELDELSLQDYDISLTGFQNLLSEEILFEKEEDIIPYKKSHILISFHPSLIQKIEEHIKKIKDIEGVEIEQATN